MTRPFHGYQNFWPRDLDLKVWLQKTFNLGHSFLTRRVGFFIFHMSISCSTPYHDFDLVTLTFDLLMKNFNPDNNFLSWRGRVFIFHMCIPCDKTLHIFYLVTLTLQVDLRLKILSLAITFESEGFLIVAIYIWLPLANCVVFLTALVEHNGSPYNWN